MPDYVFAPKYDLLSLPALEKYIKQYNHLPEVPSAIDAEKNGIALGEMNKLLLKKIEELTLHLIEKNKTIDTQQEDIKLLQRNSHNQQQMLLALQAQVKQILTEQGKRK